MWKQLTISSGVLPLVLASLMTPMALATEPVEPVESAALGVNRDLPWSEPVQIDDPFEGSFVGVFDRHYFSDLLLNSSVRIEVQSLWTREFARVLLTTRDRDCLSAPAGAVLSSRCSEFNNPRNITQLLIKIDNEIFQLDRQGSVFPISEPVAIALQNASDEVVRIRLISDTGEMIDSEIGAGTVAAWETIYAPEPIANNP
ncbi:MAG: hypothetical protein ACFB9N_02425 [Geitlerinemataceae cyanobacterium]